MFQLNLLHIAFIILVDAFIVPEDLDSNTGSIPVSFSRQVSSPTDYSLNKRSDVEMEDMEDWFSESIRSLESDDASWGLFEELDLGTDDHHARYSSPGNINVNIDQGAIDVGSFIKNRKLNDDGILNTPFSDTPMKMKSDDKVGLENLNSKEEEDQERSLLSRLMEEEPKELAKTLTRSKSHSDLIIGLKKNRNTDMPRQLSHGRFPRVNSHHALVPYGSLN